MDAWTLIRFLHVVALTFFVGGQLMLVAAVVPPVRRHGDEAAMRAVARRFGLGSLVALAVLAATGAAMASHLARWQDNVLQMKLMLVFLIGVLIALHIVTPTSRAISVAVLLVSLLVVWLGWLSLYRRRLPARIARCGRGCWLGLACRSWSLSWRWRSPCPPSPLGSGGSRLGGFVPPAGTAGLLGLVGISHTALARPALRRLQRTGNAARATDPVALVGTQRRDVAVAARTRVRHRTSKVSLRVASVPFRLSRAYRHGRVPGRVGAAVQWHHRAALG